MIHKAPRPVPPPSGRGRSYKSRPAGCFAFARLQSSGSQLDLQTASGSTEDPPQTSCRQSPSNTGYSSRYRELAGVLEQIPGVKVTGTTGRPSSFEVSVDGELIYSKLKKGKFPDKDKIVKEVKKMVKA
ncbi:Migration and invasion enhancer 1 [Liparis tanakae]|uniref:Migration and invasion enhancer 1 n=1 Tax=Liparis tanakae TaxID=230148 RepID=A0A4Z2FTC5_9TELE|nr:Migration and invasion enhancer 1 [Liparis tanakae]